MHSSINVPVFAHWPCMFLSLRLGVSELCCNFNIFLCLHVYENYYYYYHYNYCCCYYLKWITMFIECMCDGLKVCPTYFFFCGGCYILSYIFYYIFYSSFITNFQYLWILLLPVYPFPFTPTCYIDFILISILVSHPIPWTIILLTRCVGWFLAGNTDSVYVREHAYLSDFIIYTGNVVALFVLIMWMSGTWEELTCPYL